MKMTALAALGLIALPAAAHAADKMSATTQTPTMTKVDTTGALGTPAAATPVATPAVAMKEVTMKDGTKASMEGDNLFVVAADGAKTPATDGSHEMADGSKVTVAGGKVISSEKAPMKDEHGMMAPETKAPETMGMAPKKY